MYTRRGSTDKKQRIKIQGCFQCNVGIVDANAPSSNTIKTPQRPEVPGINVAPSGDPFFGIF